MSVTWTAQAAIEAIRRGAMRGVLIGIGYVEAEAVRLVLDTPKSGRIYRRRGVSHQASAPGEAFANDTGRLLNSRTIEPDAGDLSASLVFRTAYAAALEKGTRKMAPRPYATPALMNKAQAARDAIAREIEAALK